VLFALAVSVARGGDGEADDDWLSAVVDKAAADVQSIGESRA